MKNMLLISGSKYKDTGYLVHCTPWLQQFLSLYQGKKMAFVPYAGVRRTYDEYEKAVQEALAPLNMEIISVHRGAKHADIIEQADVIGIGGGNTFCLLKGLYEHNLLEPIRAKVNAGTPYYGWSAGANVAGSSMMTTNDMPITRLQHIHQRIHAHVGMGIEAEMPKAALFIGQRRIDGRVVEKQHALLRGALVVLFHRVEDGLGRGRGIALQHVLRTGIARRLQRRQRLVALALAVKAQQLQRALAALLLRQGHAAAGVDALDRPGQVAKHRLAGVGKRAREAFDQGQADGLALGLCGSGGLRPGRPCRTGCEQAAQQPAPGVGLRGGNLLCHCVSFGKAFDKMAHYPWAFLLI